MYKKHFLKVDQYRLIDWILPLEKIDPLKMDFSKYLGHDFVSTCWPLAGLVSMLYKTVVGYFLLSSKDLRLPTTLYPTLIDQV